MSEQRWKGLSDNVENTADVAGKVPTTPAPPPIPRRPDENSRSREELSPTFGDDYGPMEQRATPFSVVDALLKHPGRIVFEIMKGNTGRMGLLLFVIAAICVAGYGLIMGSFSGDAQYWTAPAKLVVGTFLSGLICLPSLYILTSLSGGNQSLSEAIGILLVSLALSGILLIGFAPIAWIFSQSTDTVVFMGVMHVLFWLVGTFFGLRTLAASFSFLNKRQLHILLLWSAIFMAVSFQMATALRPLVGPFNGYELAKKKFFLSHWNDGLNRRLEQTDKQSHTPSGIKDRTDENLEM